MSRKKDLINLMASALDVSIASMANYDADAIEYARAVLAIYYDELFERTPERTIPTPEMLNHEIRGN